MTSSPLVGFVAEPEEAAMVAEIAREIELVEAELTAQVASQVSLVAKIGSHTLSAGGKRLRPAFVSLAAKAVSPEHDAARARKLGACMEMIHMATLVHDDVIDNAATRRGRPTASSLFGNTGAILTGDVLLSKAMAILAQDGDLEIIRLVSSAVVEMAEGEVQELELRGLFEVAEEAHLDVLRMKTAAFIQSCCAVGARVADASDAVREALATYGYHAGMAFQIVDDLLDYCSTKTGKPLATDFREGCATLPLIYLAPTLDAHEREQALRCFGNGATEDDLAQIASWMRDRGAFDRAHALARRHAEQAVDALSTLDAAPASDLLATVCRFIVEREV